MDELYKTIDAAIEKRCKGIIKDHIDEVGWTAKNCVDVLFFEEEVKVNVEGVTYLVMCEFRYDYEESYVMFTRYDPDYLDLKEWFGYKIVCVRRKDTNEVLYKMDGYEIKDTKIQEPLPSVRRFPWHSISSKQQVRC